MNNFTQADYDQLKFIKQEILAHIEFESQELEDTDNILIRGLIELRLRHLNAELTEVTLLLHFDKRQIQ
jgi:aryl carrier-like protein